MKNQSACPALFASARSSELIQAVPFNEKPSREAGFLRSEEVEWENEKSKCLSCVVDVRSDHHSTHGRHRGKTHEILVKNGISQLTPTSKISAHFGRSIPDKRHDLFRKLQHFINALKPIR